VPTVKFHSSGAGGAVPTAETVAQAEDPLLGAGAFLVTRAASETAS